MERVAYAEYPIYSIASDGRFLATSGGGGGTKYGIEDQLEIFSVDEKAGKLTSLVSSSEAGGVVDSLCYNSNVDMWCGCCNDEILLLQRTEDAGFSIVLRFKASPPAEAEDKKKERLIVTRFSPSGELIVAGGERSVVSVWRVGQVPSAASTIREDATTATPSSFTSFPSPAHPAAAEASSPVSEEASAEAAASSPAVGASSANAASARSAGAPAGEQIWEAILMCELRGHAGDIKDCCISCDSNLVVSCATDGDLRLWDWKGQRLLHVFSKDSQRQQQKRKQSLLFRCCRFIPAPVGVVEKNGMQRLLAVASSSPRGPSYFVGWSITYDSGPPVDSAAASNKKNDDLSVQPPQAAPSPLLPCDAAAGGAVAPTSAVTVTQLCECTCEDGVPCSQAAVSEDGMLLALGFADGKCKVFDRGLRVVAQHQRHELPVTGLAFLRNRFLVSTSADYSIVVLDLTKRKSSSFELRRACVSFFLLLLLLLCGLAVHHAATTGYLHFIEKNEAVAIGAARDQMLHQQIETRLRQQQWDLELQDDHVQQKQWDFETPYQQQQRDHEAQHEQRQQQRPKLATHRQHEPHITLQREAEEPAAEATAEAEPARRSSGVTTPSALASWPHEKEEL